MNHQHAAAFLESCTTEELLELGTACRHFVGYKSFGARFRGHPAALPGFTLTAVLASLCDLEQQRRRREAEAPRPLLAVVD